jgi:hypothetical protein
MSRKLKPYEKEIDEKLAGEILGVFVPGSDPPTTYQDRIKIAMTYLEEANRFLESSPVADIIAKGLMKKLKRRGTPTLRVNSLGRVVLHIAYLSPKRKRRTPAELKAAAAEPETTEPKTTDPEPDPEPPERMADEVTEAEADTSDVVRLPKRQKRRAVPPEAASEIDVDSFIRSLDAEESR